MRTLRVLFGEFVVLRLMLWIMPAGSKEREFMAEATMLYCQRVKALFRTRWSGRRVSA